MPTPKCYRGGLDIVSSDAADTRLIFESKGVVAGDHAVLCSGLCFKGFPEVVVCCAMNM